MVKLDDVPEGQGRIDLADLMKFMVANNNQVPFIATGEEWLDEKEELQEDGTVTQKTGGLKIDLWTGSNFTSNYDVDKHSEVKTPVKYPDGLSCTQKYSKLSGTHLKAAMKSLGISDTEELQKAFYLYVVQPQRSGFPRLIPSKKSEKKPEKISTEK